MALFAVLTGCNSSEEVVDTPESVSARLALAVSQVSVPATRQGGDVVQTTSARDIELLRLIPFGLPTDGNKIDEDGIPKSLTFGEGAIQHWYEKTNERFFLSQDVTLVPGTASFLIYGRAKPHEGATKAENGVLVASLPATSYPKKISFGLEQICTSMDVPADAKAIAAYMNRIAAAKATIDGVDYYWKNSNHSLLKLLYRNFIGQDENATKTFPMAGSSANVRRYIEVLRFTLSNQTQHFLTDPTAAAVRDAILTEIDNTTGLPAVDYPGSIGLPDGAAVLLWTSESGFTPQVETSTVAAINNINRYCYPAELYYYANSLIKTSNTPVSSDYYYNEVTVNNWNDLLGKYTSGKVVSANTRAVAIVDPLQYAVGCLQVKLQQLDSSWLKDSQGQDVEVTETTFPLTGIIVGSQHAVGFDFKPVDSPDRFIYDNQVKTNMASGTPDYFYLSPTVTDSDPAQTLVLQSMENDAEVKILLEFQNNSDTDFFGANGGVIYRGTKFYMVGSVKRPSPQTQDIEKRVFTQDYTTLLSVKVTSLEKAYNVLPDLLAPTLEVGIQITGKWLQSTPTTVVL